MRSIGRLWPFLLILSAAAFACGDEPSEISEIPPSAVASTSSEQVVPIIVSSELVVGPNRFVLGLLRDNQEVLGAETNLRFFLIEGNTGTLKSEVVARSVRITKSYSEVHENGAVHTHEAGETGVYVADVTFDAPGDWGLEVNLRLAGRTFGPQAVRFSVIPRGFTPPIGTVPPPSRQTILSDVGGDISKVDTSNPPVTQMHNLTIANAIASGKPSVIAFASPAFCVSRICGPAKQVVDTIFGEYGSRANFIHIEPYALEEARSGKGLVPVPVMAEWGLRSEPWTFVLDRQGRVAAKFEGMVAAEEVEQALQEALS